MKRSLLWGLVATLAIATLTARAATDPPQNFVLNDAPQPIPDLQFTDGEGQPQTLANFRGKMVLLNIWATGCLPCRKEMPTLDRLQAALGGADFEVVAVSIDRRGAEAVKKFYSENGIEHLAIHIDASGQTGFTLATFGLPTTLLVDRQGQEVGRLIGPAEWDAPDMVAFIKSIVFEKQGALASPSQREPA